jgi:hypothetical protein
MKGLPSLESVQKGRVMHRGDLCVVALIRRSDGPGTWQFDRIARLNRRGNEIVAVESGLPITLNRTAAWDGERHWFTFALTNAPGDIRARDLWEWWTAQGRPTWRWGRQVQAVIRGFFMEVAA